MRRMLEELFHGNINSNEKQFVQKSEDAEYINTVSNNEKKLTAILTFKGKLLFLDFSNAQAASTP